MGPAAHSAATPPAPCALPTTVNSDATVVYGDSGNPNDVTLTWQRSNTDYYDTLQDDCHFYTYGIDLLKDFSDGAGDYAQVQMVVHNDTDNYYVQAEMVDGVYYVTGHAENEADATVFTPLDKKITLKGVEDDEGQSQILCKHP